MSFFEKSFIWNLIWHFILKVLKQTQLNILIKLENIRSQLKAYSHNILLKFYMK